MRIRYHLIFKSGILFNLSGQVGRSGVDRASSSDAQGPGFKPRPLRFKKIPLLYPKTLEVPIRDWVQLRIIELGDEAGKKQKIKK